MSNHSRHSKTMLLASALALLASDAYAAPGDLDPTFSGDGIVATAIPGATQSVARAVLELPDGKLLVAGTAGPADDGDVALVRYLETGALDPSFGTGGVAVLPLGASIARGPVGLVRRGDGKLLVAATALDGDDADILVALIDTAAAVQPGFGVGGVRRIDLGGDDHLGGLAVDTQDRAVVAGRGGASTGFAVARLTASGGLDGSFSGDGIVVTDASGAGRASAAHDLAIQTDGKIVAVGEVSNGTDLDLALVRYDDAGIPDPQFGGGDGIVVTSLGDAGPGRQNDDVARAVVLQPDGKIVAAGDRHIGGFLVVVARYDESGVLDPEFGTGGIATTETIFLGEGLTANDVVLEPSGKIVTAGRVMANQIMDSGGAAVVRFTADGDLDATFGGDGVVIDERQRFFALDALYGLLRDADGRLVAVGVEKIFPPTDPSTFVAFRFEGDPAGPVDPECRVSTRPSSDLILMRDPPRGEVTFRWKWRRGEATRIADFGDPETTDFELSVFDGNGERVLNLHAPAGGRCRNAPCWKTRPSGLTYADPARTPDGISRIVMLAGYLDGRPSIQLDARGPQLELPAMPLALPLTVRLSASNGNCWQSTFAAGGVKRNDASLLSGRGSR